MRSLYVLSLLITLLCLCSSLVECSESPYRSFLADGSVSPITHISKGTLGDITRMRRHALLVLFYTPSTAAESQFPSSEYINAAVALNGMVGLAVANCEEERAWCRDLGLDLSNCPQLRGYSSEFEGDQKWEIYEKEKSTKAIVEYAVSLFPNLAQYWTDTNYTHLRADLLADKDVPPVFLMFTDRLNTPAIFKALSMHFYDDFIFVDIHATSTGSHLFKEYQSRVTEFPSILMITPKTETKYIGGYKEFREVKDWVSRHTGTVRTPSIIPRLRINPNDMHLYKPNGKETTHHKTDSKGKKKQKLEIDEVEEVDESTQPKVLLPLASHWKDLPEISDQSCFEAFCNNEFSNRPVCAVLVLTPPLLKRKQANDYKSLFHSLVNATDLPAHYFNYVWINARKQAGFMSRTMQLKESAEPQVVFIHARKEKWSQFTDDFSIKSLSSSLLDVYNNRALWRPLYDIHSDLLVEPQLTSYTQNCPALEEHHYQVLEDEDDDFPPQSSGVITAEGKLTLLTASNFQKVVIKSRAPWFFCFCSSKDERCPRFQAEMNNVARNYNNHVRVGWVDSDVEEGLTEQFNVYEYPSCRYYPSNRKKTTRNVEKYNSGGFSEHAITALLHQYITGNAHLLNSTGFYDWLRGKYCSVPFKPTVSNPSYRPTPLPTVIRVVLFYYENNIPAYIRALSTEWEGIAYFSVLNYANSEIIDMFGVKAIPAMYIFETSASFDVKAPQEQFPILRVTPYENELSFNHINHHLTITYNKMLKSHHVSQAAKSTQKDNQENSHIKTEL